MYFFYGVFITYIIYNISIKYFKNKHWKNSNIFPISGFGKFHYYILFICGALFAAVAISITSVSFILPSAQCDFQMTSIHKGLLNGATMVGKYYICDIIYLFHCTFFRDVHGIFYLGLLGWFQGQKVFVNP